MNPQYIRTPRFIKCILVGQTAKEQARSSASKSKTSEIFQQLIKSNDLLIIGSVIIEAALLNVTKGGPIKSFPECPRGEVQNDSTVNYACSPCSQPITNKPADW